MVRIFFKIGIITIILFFGSYEKNISFSADLNKLKIEILPIASFVFALREPMRVGWYNLQKSYNKKSFKNDISKPVGSLFVQLRPKKFEREYQLALRVLKDGSKQFQIIKEITKGNKLHHKKYITIPFEFLTGAIQGEALRNIFPNDRVEFGGWLHHFTYDWETPELIAKSFTNLNKHSFPKKNYKQGETLTIPWGEMRTDLELEPLAVRKPLFIKKDETGIRYAFYRFLRGDTLYSSVVIRFIGNKKHRIRNKNAIDLLTLNGIKDAHQIPNGQIIKIPLNLIKPEYFFQVPSIYKNYIESSSSETLPFRVKSNSILPRIGKTYNLNIISQR